MLYYYFLLFVSAKNDRFWIGLNRLGTEDNNGFKWTDSSAVGYVNWDTDQPTDGEQDDCIQMSESTGAWSTLPCDNTKNWICKIRKGGYLLVLSLKVI